MCVGWCGDLCLLTFANYSGGFDSSGARSSIGAGSPWRRSSDSLPSSPFAASRTSVSTSLSSSSLFLERLSEGELLGTRVLAADGPEAPGTSMSSSGRGISLGESFCRCLFEG